MLFAPFSVSLFWKDKGLYCGNCKICLIYYYLRRETNFILDVLCHIGNLEENVSEDAATRRPQANGEEVVILLHDDAAGPQGGVVDASGGIGCGHHEPLLCDGRMGVG
jgi:hypothetical protein